MTNSYNVNFNGGFFIKNPSTRMWNGIKESLPKKKVVFEKFNDEGDKFFAVKTYYDKSVTDFLLGKKIEFRVYPDINLKRGLDSENLEQAREIINNESRILTTRKDIRNYKNSLSDKIKKNYKYKWKPEDHVIKTLKFLNLTSENSNVKIKNGVTIVYDTQGKVIAEASPNGHHGYNCIYVLPKNSDDSPKRYILDYQGNVVEEVGVLNSANFKNMFLTNVKIDKGRIRPKS